MKATIITLLLLVPIITSAQSKQSNVRINSLEENAHLKGYYYEEFIDGKVISKDGGYGVAKLNFNSITNEMLFISAKGDTLKLAKHEATAMVTIDSDTFQFHKNTFLIKVTHRGTANELFQKVSLEHVNDERKSAYGYSSVSTDNSGLTYVDRDNINNSQVDQNYVFKRNSDIFISDDKGNFFPLKQESFFKLFPAHKQEIKEYIASEKININKQADLIKLLDYTNTFAKKNSQQ